MKYTTLITPAELRRYIGNPDWAVVDCRFSLTEPERGRRDYQEAHISSAIYAHMNEDLSGPVTPGQTGRHPLPPPEIFVQTLCRWGIDASVQVVAYDDMGGAFAARLWWMLRWLGHEAVALLDGGWPRWQREGHPTQRGWETRSRRVFTPHPRPELLADAGDVAARRTDPAYRLLDARSADRYRGENETIDPVAGHIPGAISAPYTANLSPDGSFLPAHQLKARYEELLYGAPAEQTIVYCGSGVTAVHNLVAMLHAGLGEGRLYAGSWSEWITDPGRPIATIRQRAGDG